MNTPKQGVLCEQRIHKISMSIFSNAIRVFPAFTLYTRKKSHQKAILFAHIKKKNYLCAAKVEMILPLYNYNSMTTLTQEQKDAQMASMKSFDEDMPSVGIFWYDAQEHEFFGVYKKELTPKMIEEAADKGLPFINYPKLHRHIWKEKYFRALASHKPTRFTGDYTMIPRGRVAWNIDKFIVFVGKWAEDIQDELTELINQHFALPFFEFVYDEHWDLGHGWSGDF